MAQSPEVPANALLDAFPADVRATLALTHREHRTREVLIKAGKRSEWVYFPHRGMVISMTRSVEQGTTVEVGIVGTEGVASMEALLDPDAVVSEGIVQVAGTASRARLDDVRDLVATRAEVRDLVLGAIASFLSQVSQHTVCNRLHTIDQRVAKWLLGVRDRTDSDEIRLTHEFLGHMLGARRAGVTTAVGELTAMGLVTHHRASITIIDRKGLEQRSCECYRATRLHPQRQRRTEVPSR